VNIISNTEISPDGLRSADKMIPINGGSQDFRNTTLAIISGNSYTWSVYVKNAGNAYFTMTAWTGDDPITVYDLNSISVVAEGGPTHTSTIQDVGNGWRRVTITRVAAANVAWIRFRSAPLINGGTINEIDGAFIWGAQIVEGTDALPYQLTQTRLNRPRVDFSLGGCPNLLLEPQRTNLMLRSEEFDNAYWVKANVSVTANSAASPSGVINADKIIPNTSLIIHSVYTPFNISVSGGSITASVYLKADGYNFAKLIIPSGAAYTSYYRVIFNLSNGTIVSSDGVNYVGTQSITSVGNGWYRCVVTVTNAATNNSHGLEIGSLSTGVDVPYIGNGTSGTLSWGAQMELGAYPTTYIPTTAATVTRNQDTFQLSNVFTNNMISSAGGTWFVDLRNNIAYTRDGAMTGLSLDTASGSFTNGFNIRNAVGNSRLNISSWQGGVGVSLYTTTTDTAKIDIKWNGATADIFANGVKVVSASAFTPTALQFLNGTATIGVPININSMALWNTPLTDDELEVITGEGFDTYALMASNYNYILQ
jgi:hypothetical protein